MENGPLNHDPDRVSEYLTRIDRDGFVEIQGHFSPERLARVNATIERPLQTPTINGRRGYVQSGNTRFLFQTLSWSRDIIELYTDPLITAIADAYAGAPVHLSNYRIYRAYPSKLDKMDWHVDNKIDTFDEATGQFRTFMSTGDRGLILILYLSDVEEGGLQLVAGSHRWGGEKEVWNDEEPKFADRIVTFDPRPAGTAILYDYRCVHRARPYLRGPLRTSLFAQYSPPALPAGEPILLNARDLAGLSERQRQLLNFGAAPTTENWPIGEPSELAPALGMFRLLTRSAVAGVKSHLNALFTSGRQ